LTLRSQYRIKSVELSSQFQLRGKELLFEAYQERMRRISRRAEDMGRALGSIAGVYQAIDDETERRQLSASMLVLVRESFDIYREWFEELKTERQKVGLQHSSPVQIAAIEHALNLNLQAPTNLQEANQIVINWAKMIAISDSLWQDVLAKKSEDLFREDTIT